MQLPIFRDEFSSLYLKDIALLLKFSIYLPDDYIIYKDDLGSEMYFILEGKVNILSSNEIKILVSLGSGNYFGEIAIFIPNTRRICSVKAETYCQLLILKKEDIDKICKDFPLLAEKFKEEGQRRLIEYQEKFDHHFENNSENIPLSFSYDDAIDNSSKRFKDIEIDKRRSKINHKKSMDYPDMTLKFSDCVDESEMDLENMKNRQSRRIKCNANAGRRFSRKTLGDDLVLSSISELSLQWRLSEINLK